MAETVTLIPPPADVLGDYEGEEARFCKTCPLRGAADGILTGSMVWTYGVGLYRKGAAGVLTDVNGECSEPIDLPFRAKKTDGAARLLTIEEPPEYWPDRLFGTEVDRGGIIKAVGACQEPEVSQTRLLKRETTRCPALIAHMMSRSTKRKIKKATKQLSVESQD